MIFILQQITLSPLETLQGLLTVVFVSISLILGFTIMLKYFKFKRLELILVGLTWICIISPYWPDAISFLMIITTGEAIDTNLYILIGNLFVAPAHITWMYVVSNFLYKSKKKILMAIMTTEAVLFEIVFLILFAIDPSSLATQIGPFAMDWSLFIMIYLLISISLFFITGLLFAKQSLKSQDAEVRLKGKFLVCAFIIFTIGIFLEVLIDTPTEISEVIVRVFVITAAFAFYIGFIMPEKIRTLFIK